MIRPRNMLEKIQFNKRLCEFYGVDQQVDALQEAIYVMVEHLEKLQLRVDEYDRSARVFKNSDSDQVRRP